MRRLDESKLFYPWLRVLLYGQPGSTKTRTAATAAMDERTAPALLLNTAGNPISIRDFPQRPDIVEMEELKDFNYAYDWLANGQPVDHVFCKQLGLKPGYKSVIIDGVTEVQRQSFATVTGNKRLGPADIPAQVERQHFNKVLGQMVTFANEFYKLPMHVIVTSLEREDKDETTGLISYKPLLWGQSAGEVAGYAYLVARMVHRARLDARITTVVHKEASKYGFTEDAISDSVISVALFTPTGKFVAKDQYGMGLAYMADPTIGQIMDAIEKQRELQASGA